MKRRARICAFVSIIAALCFSNGCSHDISGAGVSDTSNVELNSDQLYFIKYLGGPPSMAASGSGYYFVTRNSFLYYTDRATMKTVPLCNKPDCLHALETDKDRRENCNAYVRGSGTFMVGDLLYYDSNLYYFRSVSDYNQPNQPEKYVLSQVSLDGTRHRDVFTFKDYYPQYVIIHRGFLYYSITYYDDEETESTSAVSNSDSSRAAVYRVPMSDFDKAPELIYENKGIHASITGLKGYENNVSFNSSGYLDAEMQERYNDLICYHPDTGVALKIIEHAGRTAICGGKLVYYVDDEHKAVCNLDGSDRKTLESVIGIPYCDDKYLLTDTFAMTVKDANVERRLYAYDLNGKPLQSFGFKEFVGVDVFGSDSSYIFIATSKSISEHESEYEYWRIDKSKIGTGSAKMEKYYSIIIKTLSEQKREGTG